MKNKSIQFNNNSLNINNIKNNDFNYNKYFNELYIEYENTIISNNVINDLFNDLKI
jgi:hypothetical protein